MTGELVSVVVVNWNGREYLDDCLSSLLKQSHEEMELILVDNASGDGSVEYVRGRFPQVRVIRNERNLGFGAAANRGIKEAKGPFVLFLNNDLYIEEDCIKELLNTLEGDGVGGAVPKILFFERPDRINSFGITMNYLGLACPKHFGQPDRRDLTEEETACGGIILTRKELFQEIGGFDEEMFLYHEDSDLSWRMRLKGKRLVVNPKAILYHKYHFGRNPDKFYHSEKNRLVMLIKNYSLKTLIIILPPALLVELAELFFALGSGWLGKKLKSYWEIITSLPTIVKRRRAVQKMRRVRDKEIVKLFTGQVSLSGLKSDLLDWFLSPLLALYWKGVRWII